MSKSFASRAACKRVNSNGARLDINEESDERVDSMEDLLVLLGFAGNCSRVRRFSKQRTGPQDRSLHPRGGVLDQRKTDLRGANLERPAGRRATVQLADGASDVRRP